MITSSSFCRNLHTSQPEMSCSDSWRLNFTPTQPGHRPNNNNIIIIIIAIMMSRIVNCDWLIEKFSDCHLIIFFQVNLWVNHGSLTTTTNDNRSRSVLQHLGLMLSTLKLTVRSRSLIFADFWIDIPTSVHRTLVSNNCRYCTRSQKWVFQFLFGNQIKIV